MKINTNSANVQDPEVRKKLQEATERLNAMMDNLVSKELDGRLQKATEEIKASIEASKES
jgi:hypothetical protein